MKQKQTYKYILASLAVLLAALPFLVTFNEAITKLVEKFQLYVWIQDQIVPVEVRMVALVAGKMGINIAAHPGGMTVNGIYAQVTWNCLGWQSLLLFAISLVVGLQGSYRISSKIEAVVLGILGIFFVNLFRMVFIVLLLAFSRPIFAVVYHDYLAALMTIAWLLLFWRLCFDFVLEKK